MTEPNKTHHERVLHHLHRATKHLAKQTEASQAATAAHLIAHPVVPPAATTTDGPTSPEDNNVSHA